ncbi:MAG: DUF1249 domain-containing protein [Gammaproteobacteria bacterium]|nr:DUF1249 domain-containing protein [Gammaproteobacteria bacterium]
MDTGSLIRHARVCCPGSFSGLMALYEENWGLLQALAPTLAQLRGAHRSRALVDCDLHLEVLESTRYTMTLKLTYLFAGDAEAELMADPDFTLRVYHDARQAEAVSCVNEHRHALLQRLRVESLELDRRWRRNVILNKWLSYLLECGHLFSGPSWLRAGAESCVQSRFRLR